MHKASPYKASTQWVHKMLVSPSHPHPRTDLWEQMALEALKNNKSLKQSKFVWLPLCPCNSAFILKSGRLELSLSHYLGEKIEVKLHVT